MVHDWSDRLSTPAYALVRDRLRQDVISGRLSAGTRVTIAEVAKKYDVSQMPVREAFQALQAEGILELLPHRGARVRAMSRKFVRNMYDLRGAIENLLARLAMPHLSPADLIKLDELHSAFCEAAEQNDTQKMLSLNQEFHTFIYRRGDNPEALAVFDRSANLVMALRQQYGYSAERRRQIVAQHAAMLDALRAQDEASLAEVVQRHCEEAKADLLSRMPPGQD
ncbi:MAG: GntR family transcriptional regulator [Limnochordia bacterium]